MPQSHVNISSDDWQISKDTRSDKASHDEDSITQYQNALLPKNKFS